MERSTAKSLKFISLVTLTLQNAVLGVSMRYSRTRFGPMFISSTAVVMSEVVKLFTCLFLVYREQKSLGLWKNALYSTVIANKWDTLKVCVPSFVYIVQNNLLYVSASHLDAATYQVTYQLKILTTALLSVLMLGKKLSSKQWISLVVLLTGVVMVQLSGSESKSGPPGQNRLVGFSAALGACVLSGFAGVYFEMILKGSNDVSVWMRNVQLSFLSLPLGLMTALASDWSSINASGWFYGYDVFVWYLVVLQAAGGLIVALVVKYADNILKGFATSLAIVISCVCSVYFFAFEITVGFLLGSALVIVSIFLYSTGAVPQGQSKTKKAETV
ncbi:transporter [Nesidiocoris tenuis]|uniref:Transporter n=1 Tax=Nesidiocoris tenuis TaxID=355587 RepID=A0ABN7AQB4_9HEMI|nr:transporter [Nesidiocoris tenuis]